MDVRFSGQSLYCQITRSELARLSSGRALDLIVQLPRHHSFHLSLRPSPMSADRGGWQLDSDPTGIWMTVPRAELELLGQTTAFAERASSTTIWKLPSAPRLPVDHFPFARAGHGVFDRQPRARPAKANQSFYRS